MAVSDPNDWHEEVSRAIYELRNGIITASINYEIWWVYKSKDTRPHYINSMRHYDLFFLSSIHAHFVALLTVLYRLYETRKDTHNIPRLLRLLRNHELLPANALEELDRMHALARPLWVKVRMLRNEAFSHRSASAPVSAIFEKAAIAPFDLANLIKMTQELINCLTYAWDRDTSVFENEAREVTIKLLKDLNKIHSKRISTD